jgi:flagellar biosynthesis protein FliQ
MGPKMLGAVCAVSLLAGVLVGLFQPAPLRDWVAYFIPFFISGCMALSVGMLFLMSRLRRSDVTTAEKLARRLFFKKSPSN